MDDEIAKVLDIQCLDQIIKNNLPLSFELISKIIAMTRTEMKEFDYKYSLIETDMEMLDYNDYEEYMKYE